MNHLNFCGIFAIYKDFEFRFVEDRYGIYYLYSASADSVSLGFQKVDGSDALYSRTVMLSELTFVFERKTIVKYKGDEFTCPSWDGENVMLYTSSLDLCRKYNMNERDRYEYFLYVNIKDVDEIVQNVVPYLEYNKWG